jgi:hypothetical protein
MNSFSRELCNKTRSQQPAAASSLGVYIVNVNTLKYTHTSKKSNIRSSDSDHAFSSGERIFSFFITPNGDFVAFGSIAVFCFLFDTTGNGNGDFGDEELLVFFFLFGVGVFATAETACTDSRKCTANSSLSTAPFDRSVLIGDIAGDVGTVLAWLRIAA